VPDRRLGQIQLLRHVANAASAPANQLHHLSLVLAQVLGAALVGLLTTLSAGAPLGLGRARQRPQHSREHQAV
jgi:hypothetical protein